MCSAYVKDVDPNDPMRRYVHDPKWKYHHFWKGVVQGMNLAGLCGLAVLEDRKVYSIENTEYIGFADDGVIFSDNPNFLDEFKERLGTKETGIELKEEKCK